MTQSRKIMRHQPLLPNKTSNNGIWYTAVNSTSLEEFFFNFWKIVISPPTAGIKRSNNGPKWHIRRRQRYILHEAFNNYKFWYAILNLYSLEVFFFVAVLKFWLVHLQWGWKCPKICHQWKHHHFQSKHLIIMKFGTKTVNSISLGLTGSKITRNYILYVTNIYQTKQPAIMILGRKWHIQYHQ